MLQLMDKRKARMMSVGLSTCFFLIHIVMFLMFRHYGVVPMARFNIFSMAFYLLMIVLASRTYFGAFGLCVYLEVVLHMSLAVYFTGWDSGFQITLIGMSFIMSYSEYLQRYLKMRHLHSTPICLIGMAAYLAMLVVSHNRPAPYPLPENVCYILQIGWGVTVFTISLFFLYTFVKLSSMSEEMLSNQVGHDQLTRLPNRYFMMDHLTDLERDHQLDGYWIGMADIDDFKKINDTYGHNCGDFILKEVAGLLQDSGIKMSVCRWGGEEFLMLGRIHGSMDESFAELDGLRERIMGHIFVYEGTEVRLTMTMGVAEYQPGTTIAGWIDIADQHMYKGKQNGKNQVAA